ncbi:MAG: hypothetical protein M1829_000299 [Trizodia sp. TS-e1964]|nr:MAG: hypothetical protein M1829_000299 [Trizodia sp. TS-e1964]
MIAKRPKFPATNRRKSSTPHYQTFPTKPPTSRGRPPSQSPNGSGNEADGSPGRFLDLRSHNQTHGNSLPLKQLLVLAIIALAEQTALNSISPYLPKMTSSFPEVGNSPPGLYVGIIASSFALAQLATNFLWGSLSDKIGRKPIILTGTVLTAACLIAFGFCQTLWEAVLVQVLMGLVNGNQGIIATCLGEITDRSNQSQAFVYLPVIYGLGAITGPALGGLLVFPDHEYPYLIPNLVSAGILFVDLIVIMLFLEESLEAASILPPLGDRIGNFFNWLWQCMVSSRPSYLRFDKRSSHHRNSDQYERHYNGIVTGTTPQDSEQESEESDSQISMPVMFPQQATGLIEAHVFDRNVVLILATYLLFQLSNISFNSLYPIFSQASEPTGRGLSPEEIGLSLSFAGFIAITFQIGLFGKLRDKMGNKMTYRASIAGFAVAFLLMPWVGYKEEVSSLSAGNKTIWMWVEIGSVLLIKTVAAVGGLTSALLLITNSAPNHAVLGRLNGLAQTLSAAGRAVGPLLSGGLFSLATKLESKGEALAWGTFAGIAFVGFCLSFGIRGENLEAEGWETEEPSPLEQDPEDVDEDSNRERQALLPGQ